MKRVGHWGWKSNKRPLGEHGSQYVCGEGGLNLNRQSKIELSKISFLARTY